MTTVPTVPPVATTEPAWKQLVARVVNAIGARVTDVGTTAERPARPSGGQMRWNETTKKPEWWDAASLVWRDASGTAV